MKYDVIVAGGAERDRRRPRRERNNAKVLLIEKSGLLGARTFCPSSGR